MDRYGIPTCALQQGSYHRLSRNCSHSRQGTANAFDALGFLVNDPCLQQWNPGDDGTKVLTQATQLPCLYKFPHPFRTPPCLSSYGRRIFMAPSLVGSCQVDMAPRPKTQSRNASVVRDPRPRPFPAAYMSSCFLPGYSACLP